MNGSGAANQAATTSASLAALGFKTVGVGDVTPTGDLAETVVYYGSRAPATVAAAQAVARSLTGSVIMGYDPTQVSAGAQVTVVTGTQFAVNAPTPATTPSTSATTAPVTPSTTPATSGSSAIQAPSAANTTLAPWDPRACAPNAQPTAPVPNKI
jgi:hypothetical protein